MTPKNGKNLEELQFMAVAFLDKYLASLAPNKADSSRQLSEVIPLAIVLIRLAAKLDGARWLRAQDLAE